MDKATHYNEISSMHYMVKECDVYMWHKNRWRISAFSSNEINLDNGFKEV